MRFHFPPARLSLPLNFLFIPGTVLAQAWEPYTGAENLRRLMSDTVVEAKPMDGVTSTGRYKSDGTGELTVWGETFPRTWRVEGTDQLCINVGQSENCVRLEKAVGQEAVYRATDIKSGEVVEFSVRGAQEPIVVDSNAGNAGSAAEPSAEEIAKSLANPNTPLASQTFKFQYRLFEGELPDADDQSGTTVLYQPSFPFKLDIGATLFFRPAFPIVLDQPV